MPNLMIGVSGVRGVYGDGLSDKIAERFAYAFGRQCGGTVVIGRDSRVSGPAIGSAVITGLSRAGVDVVDLGIASTPTTELAVVSCGAAGGIIITASHNPGEWNGLKFLTSTGEFISPETGERLAAAYRGTGDLAAIEPSGKTIRWDGADESHLGAIRALDVIDVGKISRRKFTVALDTVNGAGGAIMTALLESLGCTVHAINVEPTGEFPHGAEPVPENITGLCDLVKSVNADIGFAVDPDVDRLSLVDGDGNAIGEEYTLALAADFMMSHGERAAACNLSTSRMIDDVAARYGATVHRSAVGEINVVRMMKDVGAGIGGEGNGGIILPALHYGRDAVLGAALMLQLLTERGTSLKFLASMIPHYVLIKDKRAIGNRGAWAEPMRRAFAGETLDTRDGIKVIMANAWVHVRESNTEPIVRVMAEAPDQLRARALIDRVYAAIEG